MLLARSYCGNDLRKLAAFLLLVGDGTLAMFVDVTCQRRSLSQDSAPRQTPQPCRVQHPTLTARRMRRRTTSWKRGDYIEGKTILGRIPSHMS